MMRGTSEVWTPLSLPLNLSNKRYAVGGLTNPDCGVERSPETENGQLMAPYQRRFSQS